MSNQTQTQIAILLFEEFDVMDVAGPYEVLRWLPNASVSFVSTARGPIRSEGGGLALVADKLLSDVPHPDVVIVPGGGGELRARDDAQIVEWLRAAQASDVWVVSVCTGALLLGAAGVLRGKRATTYWMALDELAKFGATPVRERYVFDGRVVTSAGVSAGIDMALALAATLRSPEVAQAIQLGIEYAPKPPFNTGSPATAPAAMVSQLQAMSRFKKSA
jgi:transcriptional regulator GlxA family with amidase domain